jgi:hypothetical protein
VLRPGFFAYHLIETPADSPNIQTNALNLSPDSRDTILAFGGTAYNFGTPSGRTYAFQLTPDVKEVLGGALAPFASAQSSPQVNPNGPSPSISPLLYLEKDSAAAEDPSRAVWLQTSLYINTTPDDPLTEGNEFDQQSFVNIALGGIDPLTGGLIGARRGGAAVDFIHDNCEGPCPTQREALAFTGDIASLAGPDDEHFHGVNEPNIVIGFDSTGTRNIGRDTPLNPNSSPLANQVGSTYHVGVGLGSFQSAQTYDGEYKGYAAGLVQSEIPASDFINVVASTSPEDLSLDFDPTANTFAVNLTVRDVQNRDGATSAYHIGLGDPGPSIAVRSAYIDDLHYAAIETPGATSVDYGSQSNYQNASSTAYLASGQ